MQSTIVSSLPRNGPDVAFAMRPVSTYLWKGCKTNEKKWVHIVTWSHAIYVFRLCHIYSNRKKVPFFRKNLIELVFEIGKTLGISVNDSYKIRFLNKTTQQFRLHLKHLVLLICIRSVYHVASLYSGIVCLTEIFNRILYDKHRIFCRFSIVSFKSQTINQLIISNSSNSSENYGNFRIFLESTRFSYHFAPEREWKERLECVFDWSCWEMSKNQQNGAHGTSNRTRNLHIYTRRTQCVTCAGCRSHCLAR